MGTNYYLKTKACECCGLHDERNTMHIGKSSYGWCFSLHVDTYLNDTDEPAAAHSLEDWKVLWSKPGWVIVDEYLEQIPREKMLEIITDRRRDTPPSRFDYHMNSAVPGPNNLVRHRIDYKHCVGHGEGTWDYIKGVFS